jgi:hypothetical protein
MLLLFSSHRRHAALPRPWLHGHPRFSVYVFIVPAPPLQRCLVVVPVVQVACVALTIALVLVLRLDYYRGNRRPPSPTLPFLFAVSDGSVLPRHTGRRSVTIKKPANVLRRTRFRPRPRRLLWDSRDQKPKATFAWRRKRAVRSRLCCAISFAAVNFDV